MAKFLFDVEDRNRLAQKGLLKRFSIDCYGKQLTLEDIRSIKAEKYKELSDKRNTKEYNMWFLKYEPGNKEGRNEKVTLDKTKQKTKKNMEKEPPLLRLIKKRQQTRKIKSVQFLF
jgi:hypothetical protein